MNRQNQVSVSGAQGVMKNTRTEQLIDLFVELCFEDINDVKRISQFHLLSLQLGFDKSEIVKVIEIGKLEYQTLMDEIYKVYIESELT